MKARRLTAVWVVLCVAYGGFAVRDASNAAAWVFDAALAVGFAVLAFMEWRTPRRPDENKAQVEDGIRASVLTQCRERSTRALIAMHNEGQTFAAEGSPATFADDLMPAIEVVLAERGVPLCPCGAPLPGGIHATTCQES